MKNICSIKDGVADLTNFRIEDEFVVEAMNHKKLFAVAGKAICNRSLLGNCDLEIIWDLANWGVSQPKEVVIKGSCYDGMLGYTRENFLYIPLRKDIDVVNENVMIRKHYDINNGYYLRSDRSKNFDDWRYATRQEITTDMKLNPFI